MGGVGGEKQSISLRKLPKAELLVPQTPWAQCPGSGIMPAWEVSEHSGPFRIRT